MALTKVTSGLISADAASVDLNIDAGTLYIDSTNNRVGIGTTPAQKLHIVDTSNPGSTTGSVIIEGQRDGTANLLELRAKDNSAPSSALPSGQGGIIRMNGFDGTDFEEMAYIAYQAEAVVADGDAPSRLMFGTTSDGAGAATERMRIDSSGNVGIGTSSPSQKLEVSGGSGTAIRINDTTTNSWDLINDGNLKFSRGGTERMRIDSSGNVGLGQSSPSYRFDVRNSNDGHVVRIVNNGTNAGSRGVHIGAGNTDVPELPTYQPYIYCGASDSAANSLAIVSEGGTSATGGIDFWTGPGSTGVVERMRIDRSGDISFYEDTGSTAKLFWDASGESLSIGTTGSTTDRRFQISSTGTATATTQYGIVLNPTYSTDVTGGVYNLYSQPNLTSGSTVTNVFSLYMEANGISGSSVTNSYGIYQAGANDKNYFNGDISIGHTSPSAALDIWGDTSNQLRLRTASSEYYSIGRNSSTGFLEFYGDQTGYVGYEFKNGNTTIQGRDNVNATLTIKTASTNDYNGYLNFDDNGGTRAFLRSNHYNNYFEINSGNAKYCFNTATSANNGSVSMLARANTGAVNNVYWFNFLEANDNQSAAGGKFGGILASASYSVANPDRGDIYAQDNVSALSFTDRTPYPTSLQLAKDVINSHQRRSEEEIDELVTNAYNRLVNEEHEMPQPSMDLTLEEYKAKYKKEYELDHSVLHEYVDDRRYADDGVECRDLSATASCLVEVVKNLLVEIDDLKLRIQTLEGE